MKKPKFILPILVLMLFISVFCIYLTASALTPEQSNSYLAKGTSCDARNLQGKYDIKLEKLAGNKFRISVNGADKNVKGVEFELTAVKKGSYEFEISSLPVITKYKPLEVEIAPVTDDKQVSLEDEDLSYNGNFDPRDKAVMVIVSMTSSSRDSDGCNSFKTYLEYKSPGDAVISTQVNTEYNSNIGSGKACTNFINGIYNRNQFNNGSNAIIKEEDFKKYNYAAVNADGKRFYEEFLTYCFQNQVPVGTNYSEEETTRMIADALTTWKAYSATESSTSQTFNEAFNEIYTNALTNGKFMGLGSSIKLDYKNTPNYCDWKKHESEIKDDGTKDYYVNKDYYYAEKNEGEIKATYTYNYAPGDTKKETVTVCSKVCKEAVKVEYGPPVASKAGLCFEYKVKVTSYVKCDSSIKADPPENNKEYCTPAPMCYNSNVGVLNQAGPNEEFEACVEKCDGGKYTQACSLECYNKVYGKQKNKQRLSYKAKVQANRTNNSVLDACKKAHVNDENGAGCYYWFSDEEIKWASSKNEYTYGRWYYLVNYNLGADELANTYKPNANGIKTAINVDGTSCNDSCYWTGCSKGQYLNPKSANQDYKENSKEYKSAVAQCKAAATCSKKTATFTIAVKYDTADSKGNITVNKVYYPYTSSSQKVTNPEEGSGEYELKDKDTFTDGKGDTNDLSTIIDYNGCYKSEDNKRWYLTEWGFPGTYINNKTGAISFGTPEDISGWYLEKKKFCLPLNAKSVNKLWWEWKVVGNECISDEAINKELEGKPGTSNGYNIEAIVNDFGYFGWDFNIKCFYAIRNEVCTEEKNSICCDKDSPGDDSSDDEETDESKHKRDYKIRTIDRKNMFPNSSAAIDDDQRRGIGFNWTSKATILSEKNPNYHVNPEELRNKIESLSDSLYDEEPDYQFYLTPKDLTKIRQYNKNNGYNDWNGRVSIENGVHVYKSNLFRQVGSQSTIIDPSDLPLGELGINNQ